MKTGMIEHATRIAGRIENWRTRLVEFSTDTGTRQAMLFGAGIGLLVCGLSVSGLAESNYNDERLADATNAILTYLEGSFGALVMVSAGIGAILSSAFGQYRAALGCLVVAVGSFILRSVLGTFFNDINITSE